MHYNKCIKPFGVCDMLGIQNSLPVNNSVKFGHRESYDYNHHQDYSYDTPAEADSYSQENIESERDAKLDELNKTRASFDELADTFDKNPNAISKGASKVVRFASAAVGVAATFVMAKYGSKVTIGALRNFAKSKTVTNLQEGAKKLSTPLTNGFKVVSEFVSRKATPLMDKLKNSQIGKKVVEFAEKPKVKNVIETVQGYKEAAKTLIKNINGDKVQTSIENTMAASTTASVIIDDLAGRNNNKSNVDLALGASGGDQ